MVAVFLASRYARNNGLWALLITGIVAVLLAFFLVLSRRSYHGGRQPGSDPPPEPVGEVTVIWGHLTVILKGTIGLIVIALLLAAGFGAIVAAAIRWPAASAASISPPSPLFGGRPSQSPTGTVTASATPGVTDSASPKAPQHISPSPQHISPSPSPSRTAPTVPPGPGVPSPGPSSVGSGTGGGQPPTGGRQPSAPVNGRIAYAAPNLGGVSQIWAMDQDGTHITQLTASTVPSDHPAWSPNGRRIAYDSGGIITTMNPDGTGAVALVAGGASDPAWSPDGSRIAFAAAGIKVMNANASGQVSLTTSGQGFQHTRPAWSPDGTKIAFNYTTGGGRGIMVMNADGTNMGNLPCGICYDPAWSPDGTKIAYGKGLTPALGLYVINLDGTDEIRIAANPGGSAGGAAEPAWSPDQSRIAFSGSNPAGGPVAIYVMNATGGAQAQLVSGSNPSWQRAG